MKPVFIGELNPYGPREDYALLDRPKGSAGERLRRMVLGVHSQTYRTCARYNLCDYQWSLGAARTRAHELQERHPGEVLVLLGAKVRAAFGLRPVDAPAFSSGTTLLVEGGRWLAGFQYVALPHPSGLCRLWGQPGAVAEARRLVALACPDFPLGEAEASTPLESHP